MEIWAHRGRASPEKLGNSISDFMDCYHLPVTGIETDVSLTADNRPIIYHPGNTYPDLTKMTWREIQNSIFDVLSLSSFLRSLKCYSKMSCLLDIKQDSEELVEKVVRTIADHRLQDRVFITAFQKRLVIPLTNIAIPLIDVESGVELLIFAKKIDPQIKTHLIALWPWDLPKLVRKY